MRLFDSHCHLDDRAYDTDIDRVLTRAKKAGVQAVMIAGITRKSCTKAVSMANQRDGVYVSVGIHPHDAKECSDSTLTFLRELVQNSKVRAWGEIGLDYNRMYSPRQTQEKWFLRQLEIADELDLPLIFHERDTQGRFLDILNAHHRKGRKGVVHCFGGNRRELEAYLKLGFCIGITGILTLKGRGAQLRELVPLIPRERLVVETDAPYLTPAPQKNHTRRNEPAFVKSTFLTLAAVRGEEPEMLSEVVWSNTCHLYDIQDP